MSSIIGKVICTHKGCNQVADFKKDKRKKLFIVCPLHGRIPYSTNEGQKVLQDMVDDGLVYFSESELLDAEKSETKPEPIPEPTAPEQAAPEVAPPEIQPEKPEEIPESGRSYGGLIALTFGVLTGIGFAAWKKKKASPAPQTTSTFHHNE